MRRRVRFFTMMVVLLTATGLTIPAAAHDDQHGPGWHGQSMAEDIANMFLADSQPVQELEAQSLTTCESGSAAGFPCSNVDLAAFLPLADIGGGKGNDIWGWSHTADGVTREFAIMGRSTGTSFVEITDPVNPVYLGNLPTASRFASTWRDMKVHADHVFVVSEALNHGMQVFDLNRLLSVSSPPVTFSADANFSGFKTAHNIAINEASATAYVVGANVCSGGLYMVDISAPTSPVEAGCYSGDGYTHDAQCVNYEGPDAEYSGHELCFASNEDTLTIVDVTDKANPIQVARVSYPGAAYTHQGWLTEDSVYFLVDDELDEDRNGHNTRTYVFNVSDVDAPAFINHWEHPSVEAIDHNQYIVGNHTFQANYRAGLRILELTDLATASLTEVGYFDIYPDDNAAEFNGAWSNYPFFASGTVIVSGIEQGLFVLIPNLGGETNTAPTVDLLEPPDGTIVSGTEVLIEIAAADSEDGAGTLEVTWQVDGGDPQPTTYDEISGTYKATWDSTTVGDGDHTITPRATDSGGKSATDTHTVTVDNVAEATMHVHDLDGSATGVTQGRWTATVEIEIRDSGEAVVAGAEVTGDWSTGGSSTCTTGTDGRCSVSMTLRNNLSETTFTVTGVTASGYVYDSSANHDGDDPPDSNGTSIAVTKPS